METINPIISIALMATLAFAVIWVSALIGVRVGLKGSHHRYVWSSVERVTRYPAGFYLIISAWLEWTHGVKYLALCQMVGVALWVCLAEERRRNGDNDDFWSDLKKKIANFGHRTATSAW